MAAGQGWQPAKVGGRPRLAGGFGWQLAKVGQPRLVGIALSRPKLAGQGWLAFMGKQDLLEARLLGTDGQDLLLVKGGWPCQGSASIAKVGVAGACGLSG